MAAIRWSGGALALVLCWSGCSKTESTGNGDGDGDLTGDGDGDAPGDGDRPGDGDGDGDTSGDGDGDGDGDTPGDGDGDLVGDGDGDTPGDGDGDLVGDGDGDVSACTERAEALLETAGNVIAVSPAGAGRVTVDGTETTLRAVIAGASEGDTILLRTGTYTFDEAAQDSYTGLYVTTPNITILGETGDAQDIVLDSNYADHGEQTAVISIDAPGVVLANFTVRRSIFHLVHLWENGDDAILFNLTLEDGGQQFIKASPGSGTVDGVEVGCSRFFMTEEGRDNVWGYGDADGSTTCYTGGIDTHDATNWWVHDSQFEGIYCDTDPGRPAHGKKGADRGDQTYSGGLAEHAIHMWNSASGTSHIIERNLIIDCGRGIGIGMADTVYGTLIRNNVLMSAFGASSEHDVAISVERGVDTQVLFNTVYYESENAYPNSIEVRWAETDNVTVHGNFLGGVIALRDGAAAIDTDNVTSAPEGSFLDPLSRDLHWASCETAQSAAPHPEVTDDFDGTARGDAPTVGAYECAP